MPTHRYARRTPPTAGQCLGQEPSLIACGGLNQQSNGKLGDVVLTGAVTINTTTGTVSTTAIAADTDGVELISQAAFGGQSPPQLRVYHFKSLTVDGTVTVVGDYGAALLTQGNLTINGSVLAKGTGGGTGQPNKWGVFGAAGPGGFRGGEFN